MVTAESLESLPELLSLSINLFRREIGSWPSGSTAMRAFASVDVLMMLGTLNTFQEQPDSALHQTRFATLLVSDTLVGRGFRKSGCRMLLFTREAARDDKELKLC